MLPCRFLRHALEAFAAAIDVKHVNIHGHSLRVGRYARVSERRWGWSRNDTGALRSRGYLHDIGKLRWINVCSASRRLWIRKSFREMADHTIVGHQIVSGVQFPWPRIPEIVRAS